MTQQLKFSYTLSGTVDLNDMGEAEGIRELKCNLDSLTSMAMGQGLITCDTEMTVDSYEAVATVGHELAPKYPISRGSHIIQYHDETFVWYDEAGLQGGVEYSLEHAQSALKRYAEAMNAPKLDPAAFAPITAEGYEPGEIPHHAADLEDYVVKLLEQNEAMRTILTADSITLAERMVTEILKVAPANYAGHTFGVTKADGTVLGDVIVTVVKPGGKAPHELIETLSTAVASAVANSATGPVGEVRISQQDYDTLRSLVPLGAVGPGSHAICESCHGEQEPVDAEKICKTCREWDAEND